MKTMFALLLISLSCLAQTGPYHLEPKPGKTGEFISIRTEQGLVFKNARIIKANALEVKIMHDDGVTTLSTEGFPDEMRWAWGSTDPDERAKAEQEINNREQARREIAKARMEAIKAENASAAKRGQKDEKKTISVSMEMSSALAKEIKARAAKEWPHNFPMQEYETKRQVEACLKLQLLLKTGIQGMPADESDIVIAAAMQNWKDDYVMVVHEINRQAKAYQSLNR
jgi:hypothetical protein